MAGLAMAAVASAMGGFVVGRLTAPDKGFLAAIALLREAERAGQSPIPERVYESLEADSIQDEGCPGQVCPRLGQYHIATSMWRSADVAAAADPSA
jgi:hypothetical protein